MLCLRKSFNPQQVVTKRVFDNFKNRSNKGGRCFSTLKLEEDLYKDREKPYHFPYERIPWNIWTFWRDPRTKSKFNENTKIIQIDGNIAAGKEEFGKRLAEKFGMKWVGQPDFDDIYINPNGFDYRSLNSKLPEHLRTCDLKMWHEDPGRESAIHMQHYMFIGRVDSYIDALAHMFNTGQGVVMERSFLSERALVEAMHKMGWLPLGFMREDGTEYYDWRYRYNFIRKLFSNNLLLPHLTIYLDVPTGECMKRIKDSSDPIQRNSKALVPKFLDYVEDWYKNKLLDDMAEHGWVLRYDHTKSMDNDELMDVIDDIRELDFDIDPHDTRFITWNVDEESGFWLTWRYKTTCDKVELMRWISQPDFDISGLGNRITQADLTLLQDLIINHKETGAIVRRNFDPRYTPFWKILFGIQNYRDEQKWRIYNSFT